MLGNPYFAAFGAGVAEAAERYGYELRFISPLQGSLASAVGRAAVDGVIAIGLSADHPEVEQIRRARLPLVLVDAPGPPDIGSVVVDDEAGAERRGTPPARSGPP